MDTSAVSSKPTLYAKSTQAVESDKSAQKTSGDNLTADNSVQPASGDSVKLSSESLQLAKSANASERASVPAIEDRAQAKQVAQNIVEQLRQRTADAVGSQGGINGGKLKSLLA